MCKKRIPSPEKVMEIRRRITDGYISEDGIIGIDVLDDIDTLSFLINEWTGEAWRALLPRENDLSATDTFGEASDRMSRELVARLAEFVPKKETEKVQEDLHKWTEDTCYDDWKRTR